MKRIKYVYIFLFVAVVALYTTTVQAVTIKSTFDTDAEGWTLTPGGGTLTWLSSGGNPGGHLTMRDDVTGPLKTFAPSPFLGDLSAFDGGALSVDTILLQTASGAARGGFGIATITGASGTVSLDLVSGVPPTNWTTYSAPLTSTAWGVSQFTWVSIISNVTEIAIEVDSYVQFGDTIGFDNFSLTSSPVPEPATIALLGIGLAGLGGGYLRGKFRKNKVGS